VGTPSQHIKGGDDSDVDATSHAAEENQEVKVKVEVEGIVQDIQVGRW